MARPLDEPMKQPTDSARPILAAAALLGFAAVLLSALGAHAFDHLLVGRAEVRFESALRLHLAHVPALLAVGLAQARCAPRAWTIGTWLLLAGVLVFCGELYLAALTPVTALIPIVPWGGAAMMTGWLVLAWGFVAGKR
jgi:uncharacterized membrane protein YgdD (TMEM256/DUF423 family)